jgi:phosphatidylserine/phosphatidylglycerophosphate/cardiolipin synthase-like enzyme
MRRALVLGLLLAALPAAGDIVRMLDDPRDAAQARVDIIQQARHEIDAVYFLARNDRITLSVLALLRDARWRGVGTVRLIVDANFQHIPKPVLAHLRDEGVQVRAYHPLTLRHPTWVFRRMHEKIVVADGARYVTGGRNLGEAYFGLAKRNFIDRDIYVEGESAQEAQRHFDELWASGDVVELDARVTPQEKRKAMLLLDESATSMARAGFVRLDGSCDWTEGRSDAKSVEFLHDPIVDGGGPRVAVRLAQLIDSAQTSVVIESAYVVPSRNFIELLERKLAAGVQVQIVTNSLRSTDGVLPYAGYVKYKRRLLRRGADIREYKGPDTLHAKTLVVDGRTALVGSYNLDPRSQNLNAEAMCVVEDASVARELLASIDRHVQNAWRVETREHRMHVPRVWRIRAWAARLFLPLYERQL